MPTTITGAWQIPVEYPVAPEIDASGAADHGEDEAQAAMDVLTTQGYFGHSPSDEGSGS